MARTDSKGVILVAEDNVESPDLILLDAVMPHKDGFTVCRELKMSAELQDIPVIFMTGLSDTEDVVKGLESGGVDYLTKPVRINELLARVQVHMHNARKTQSARGALNELGQPAFSCSVHGELHWCTSRATEMLESLGVSCTDLQQALEAGISDWLTRSPQKHSQTRITLANKNLNVRLLGQPYPGEYLLRLVDEDDLVLCRDLRQKFQLTEREAEVLLWLARGKSNQEIGQILTMSPRTVNKHLEQVFRKLNVENRTAAAAVSLGFLSGVQLL